MTQIDRRLGLALMVRAHGSKGIGKSKLSAAFKSRTAFAREINQPIGKMRPKVAVARSLARSPSGRTMIDEKHKTHTRTAKLS